MTSSPRVAATRYYFSKAEIGRVVGQIQELLETGAFLSMGRYCQEFEAAFAQYLGMRHAAAVSNGTAALELILRALDVRGADVIVPTNTFAATVFAILHAGGRPIFADTAPDMTLDPTDMERRLTPRTRVVVTVHIGGLVSPLTTVIQELCRQRGLSLVEDAAHAHGSALAGQPAGTFGVAAAFSFFPTKVMTTGEGGMVVTSDADLYRRVTRLKDQAKVDGRNYHEEIGHNYRMTEIAALLGLSQLRQLDGFISRRIALARLYTEELAGLAGVVPLPAPTQVRHNYYKYIVFLQDASAAAALARRLQAEHGITLGGRVYELPCHLQPALKEFAGGPLPVAEDLAGRHLCLPLYPSLHDEEARYVAEAIRRCLA